MADCLSSVFCGGRSQTDTLKSQKSQSPPTDKHKSKQVEKQDNKQPGLKEKQASQAGGPVTPAGLEPTSSPPSKARCVTVDVLQRDWQELKEAQCMLEREVHAQEKLKLNQQEKLRTLKNLVTRKRSRHGEDHQEESQYQQQEQQEMAQSAAHDISNSSDSDCLPTRHHGTASMHDLHSPFGFVVNHRELQRPDLLPLHRSLPPDMVMWSNFPSVSTAMDMPLPSPTEAINEMRHRHFERLNEMQQQIRHQHNQYFQMMHPHAPLPSPLPTPLPSPLPSPLTSSLPSPLPSPLPTPSIHSSPMQIHQSQLQHLQLMQQHLSQLHTASHDSIILQPFDLRRQTQDNPNSHRVSNDYNINSAANSHASSSTNSYYVEQASSTSEQNSDSEVDQIRMSRISMDEMLDHRQSSHVASNNPACYSNVDISNSFPVQFEDRPRPNSVYEGFFSSKPRHTSSSWLGGFGELPSDESSSDLPSMDDSDIGSLSELLSAGHSSSNLSTSEGTEVHFSDSEIETLSHYDDLPPDHLLMDVSDNDIRQENPYAAKSTKLTSDMHNNKHKQRTIDSDFSDFSEDNTSEITNTYSQSLDSSCSEDIGDCADGDRFNCAKNVWIPDLKQSEFDSDDCVKGVIDNERDVCEDVDTDVVDVAVDVDNANVLNTEGQWSELSKSVITGFLEELDTFTEDESFDEEVSSTIDCYKNDDSKANAVTAKVNAMGESDYDADTDTIERKCLKTHNSSYSNDGIIAADAEDEVNDDIDDDDDGTLTGDSCDSDNEAQKNNMVLRCAPPPPTPPRNNMGGVRGVEGVLTPVVKRRGICQPQIGLSQTSLGNVSHAKMSMASHQQKPFTAKKTTWAMSCLRPCPPVRPSNSSRGDDATKSPRIGRKSSVNRRKPAKPYILDKFEDVKTLEDDAHLLKVIEAYCTSAKTRQTVNSSLLDTPQILIAEDEKIIVEERKGNQTVVEEKTLVDTVYSLRDQVKDLVTEHKRMRRDLDDEKKARKRLEGLLRKSLRSLVETTWEESVPTS